MLDAGYRKSTTRLSALVSRNPSPFAARGRLNLFDSKATLIRFFVGHRYRARLLEVRDDCRVAISRKFGEGAVGISMTPKACRHSAFKIKRFVPRNRWKFPRSSAATEISLKTLRDSQRVKDNKRSLVVKSRKYRVKRVKTVV